MSKVAILQANLGSFDTPVDPVEQNLPVTFHRWTDDNFPPIAGLTPRLQYRIPKLFGWQMFPSYDYYIWLDGNISFKRPDCAQYYLDQLGGNDVAFFKHPNRSSIKEEVEHIDNYANRRAGTSRGQDYIISRYKNGLHKEQLALIHKQSPQYVDDTLYASTTFIYRNSEAVRRFLTDWWLYQSRYFTCDQVPLPYLLWKHQLKVTTFDQPLFKTGYHSLVGHHK